MNYLNILRDYFSGTNRQLTKELRSTFKNMPVLETSGLTPSEAAWRENANRLRKLVLTKNPRNFLQWNVIKGAMFVNNSTYAVLELEYLKKRSNWDDRWKQAITETGMGNPIYNKDFPLSSDNLIHHAYHIARFEEETGLLVNDIKYVFEFGGGYGSMCRLFHNLSFNGKYIIFDLPSFSALQMYFLKNIGLSVTSELDGFMNSDVNILCLSDINELQNLIHHINKENSMFMATWSISETQMSVRNIMLPLIEKFKAFLIAYQASFGEVDNIKFFEQWKNTVGNVIWKNWEIDYIPGNYYLMGRSTIDAKS